MQKYSGNRIKYRDLVIIDRRGNIRFNACLARKLVKYGSVNFSYFGTCPGWSVVGDDKVFRIEFCEDLLGSHKITRKVGVNYAVVFGKAFLDSIEMLPDVTIEYPVELKDNCVFI